EHHEDVHAPLLCIVLRDHRATLPSDECIATEVSHSGEDLRLRLDGWTPTNPQMFLVQPAGRAIGHMLGHGSSRAESVSVAPGETLKRHQRFTEMSRTPARTKKQSVCRSRAKLR